MKFKKIESLIVAEAVLNELINNSNKEQIEISVECYQNGREHGFVLWSFWDFNNKPFLNNKAYYICQHRRSDEIAIYKGNYVMQSISDDAYKNLKIFDNGCYKEAAKWILEDIKKEYLLELSKNKTL